MQLHRLDAAPQALKPAWRRGPVQSRGQQVQRLPCQTTEFRCHQGRVKVWPETVQGSGFRVLPGPPSRFCQHVAQGAGMHVPGANTCSFGAAWDQSRSQQAGAELPWMQRQWVCLQNQGLLLLRF